MIDHESTAVGTSSMPDWYVCQIGAREHFSIARALHQKARLRALMTDAWSSPTSPLRHLSKRFEQRYHPDLEGAVIAAASGRATLHTGIDRVTGRGGWQSIMARNAWFSKWAANKIAEFERGSRSDRPTVFAYSYAAKHIFEMARETGIRTILGQIDPGPLEARMVAELYASQGQSALLEPIPDAYWQSWRTEIELADTIVVNSKWSAQGLIEEGVPSEKIQVVPLALGHRVPDLEAQQNTVFSADRPLKLLFLGQVTLRKGIHLVFEAARRLANLPIQIDIVGDVQVDVPDVVANDPRIRLHGRVTRDDVWGFYQSADAFLFPTFSDGFGLTQLEAMEAGVPVICSNRCGDVVTHNHNGFVLDELTGAHLASVIEQILGDPQKLLDWKSNCQTEGRFEIAALAETLLRI